MVEDRLAQIKAAHLRRQKAIAERLEQLREDRNEEMDCWDDDAPYIIDAYRRLMRQMSGVSGVRRAA